MITDMAEPLTGVKLAVSVDDLFGWLGSPRFEAYSFVDISKSFTKALAGHGLREVYAFSNTAPVADEQALRQVFDHWADAGHHVGNHTHHHASLTWLKPADYIIDIERTGALIEPWFKKAPRRYFRHCFDMWGETAEKRAEVWEWLNRHQYTVVPVSIWFDDAAFSLPFSRALALGDIEAQAYLRARFVETAVEQLRVQAAAARLMFAHEPAHIWIIHGTPIAADCLRPILDRFAELGVQFIPLEAAMSDAMNIQQPVVTAEFRNQVQKWAMAKGVTIEQIPSDVLEELDEICPIPGQSASELGAAFIAGLSAAMKVDFQLSNVRL